MINHKCYPLTHPQKRMLYTEIFHPGTSVNHLAFTTVIGQQVDYSRLEQAINFVISNNEGMRLQLVKQENEEYEQCIGESPVLSVAYYDFSCPGGEARYRNWLEQQIVVPFVLLESVLFDFAMLKLPDDRGGFYLKMHHIISDGWTMSLVTNQVVEYYNRLMQEPAASPEKNPSYLDYLSREQEYFSSEQFVKDKSFWNEQFATLPAAVQLPLYNSTHHTQSSRQLLVYPDDLSTRIRKYCQVNGTTFYRFFLTVVYIYIAKATGAIDMVIGVPHHNRQSVQEKNTVGMFTSTIPLYMAVDPAVSFTALLNDTGGKLAWIIKNHQQYPYDLLIADLRKKHKATGDMLNVIVSQFGMNNIGISKEMHGRGNMANPLTISINPRFKDETEAVELAFDYQNSGFTAGDIDRMGRRIIRLSEAAVTCPATRIAALDWVPAAEKQHILAAFTTAPTAFPQDKTIQDAFEAQVSRTPEHIAVIYEGKQMTYGALNARANQLAHFLRSQRVGPDSIVALMVERSLDMLVGIWGIIKAGGAYLPLDPDYPPGRIGYMLQDSGTGIVLTQAGFRERLADAGYAGRVFNLDSRGVYAADITNPENLNTSTNLVYVIYTSGSTGEPKGVMVEHRNLVNFVYALKTVTYDRYPGRRRFALLAPYVFDASVRPIFVSLAFGHTLCVVPEADRFTGDKLIEYYNRYTIDFSDGTPVHLRLLNSSSECMHKQLSVKDFSIGGQALPLADVKSFFSGFNYTGSITNVYGPTECCDIAATFTITRDMVNKLPVIPVGKPLANARLYILDEKGEPVPIGVGGELHIGGAGVARGYLNRPELTAEKFIPNPFVPGERMYRTGDLARWLPDGNVDFLGRVDFQVKLRGYRIELGEIEACLRRYHSIRDTVVILRQDTPADEYLCAYIVADESLTVAEIRDWLQRGLPEYMIPTCFVQLEQLPLTLSGKVDRMALPVPTAQLEQGSEYEPPTTAEERALVVIWQEVLGIEPVGITDNFFALGGHSLKAMQVIARLHEVCGAAVSLKDFFIMPTIKELAARLIIGENSAFAGIGRVPEQEYYPASAAQRRFYFLSRFYAGSIIYNVPVAVIIKGEVDRETFAAVIRRLAERHEVLRTSLVIAAGEVVQQVCREAGIAVEYADGICQGEEGIAAAVRTFIRPFELDRAPLVRMKLMHMAADKYVWLIDMHHSITDGVSVQILLAEFQELYGSLRTGCQDQLAALTIQYKDYAVWQKQRSHSPAVRLQMAYWLKVFADGIPVLDLATDFPRPAVKTYAGDQVVLVLDSVLTAALNRLALATGTTVYMVLLAALNILLAKYSGQDAIVVGTATAGRQHAATTNLLGVFVNTLAIRNFPVSEKSFQDFLAAVKVNVLTAFENQDCQFEELVERLAVRREANRNPLFDVMLIMQNTAVARSGTEELTLEVVDISEQFKVAKLDIIFQVVPGDGQLTLQINYSTELFARNTIKRLGGYYRTILEQVIADPAVPVGGIDMLTVPEKQQLLVQFNNTAAAYRHTSRIHRLFEEQAGRTPDALALVYEGQQLTYRELNIRANRLAYLLRAKGIGQNTVVAVMVERSLDMIVAIMGILKAGGAYLPLDPDYPGQRIEYMLDDSRADIMLTQAPLIRNIRFDGEIICLDTGAADGGTGLNLPDSNQAEDLAYVIYTSGSTGRPKGVMIEHRAVLNFMQGMIESIDFAAGKTMLNLTTISFDIFGLETLVPLMRGLTVVIAGREEQSNIAALVRLVNRQPIDMVQMTPARGQLLERAGALGCLQHMTDILLGGEALPPRLLESIRRHSAARLYNLYGPTETTIWSTVKHLTADSPVTIGRPIANTYIYIVECGNQLQPVGIPGELYIGGHGLARGYLNRPELTAEKFVANPFRPGERMYRTGDRARWLPDGDIEYLGRLDDQVKVRGHRIELKEIEVCLTAYPGVDGAVVSAKQDRIGEQVLCAYFVANDRLAVDELRRYISGTLPQYMVPAYFIQLDKMPLTPNGKVDRKALPEPQPASETGYVAPHSATERLLAVVWQEVLGMKEVGAYHNFFELGGDSIQAMLVAVRLADKGLNVKVADIFRYPIIAELSRVIDTAGLSVIAAGLDNQLQGNSAVQTGITGDTAGSGARIRWLPAQDGCQGDNVKPKLRVFCLPYAGGSASMYFTWGRYFSREIELCPVELPGRGQRYNEPLRQQFADVLADVYQAVSPWLDDGVPYCFVGHSMGALLSYELCRTIRSFGRRGPVHVFLSGTGLPHRAKQYQTTTDLTGEQFRQVIIQQGGLGADIAGNIAYWEMVQAILRADMRVVETYRDFAVEAPVKLACGITVLNGREEAGVGDSAGLEEWQQYTSGRCNRVLLDGGHFFIRDHAAKIVSVIEDVLVNEVTGGE